MAKIQLVETGFSLISEGEHTFKITGVEYDEDFGRMQVQMVNQNGAKHTERYSFLRQNGELNEGAQKAFSFFAKTALNNFDLEEIDSDDLVGCYVKAEIEHVESETISEKTGRPFVNANLNNLQTAVGFGGKKSAKEEPVEDNEDDLLDDFLD